MKNYKKNRYALTIISKKNKMMQKSTTFTTILRVKKCHFHYDMQKIVICTTSYESHTFFHEFAD
jgi:hypothetical protein